MKRISTRWNTQRKLQTVSAPLLLRLAPVFALLFLLSSPIAAQKYSDWTGWQGTNDSLVQWRSRMQDWGRNIASSCDIEFRVTVDGKLTFKYSMSYQPWRSGSSTGERRSGTAYNVKRDRDHGSEFIDGCRQVTAVTVSNVVSISDETSTAKGGARKFSRPALTNVQLEPHCVDLLRAESDKLQLAGAAKKLIAWSPLLAVLGEPNAVHAAVMVGETHWAELGESLSTVDKLVFIGLANDARLHANSGDHWNNPSAKAFWNAMADFYSSRAQQ